MSNTDTAQIKGLRTEAGVAGDAEMVRTCDQALEGDEDARRTCLEAIANAQAMDDGFVGGAR